MNNESINSKKDVTVNTDFTKLTDAELIQIEKKWEPVSQVYLKTVNERCRRQTIKEQKNNRSQNIIITITILGLIVAVITLILSFYKK